MNRMEGLRERLARAMFFGKLEDDGADPGDYWRARAGEALAACADALDEHRLAMPAHHPSKFGLVSAARLLRSATKAGGMAESEVQVETRFCKDCGAGAWVGIPEAEHPHFTGCPQIQWRRK